MDDLIIGVRIISLDTGAFLQLPAVEIRFGLLTQC
jgi:hypothetical protein